MRQGNNFRGRDDDFRGHSGNGGFGRRNFDGPREMHKAKCADCGADCEVPFKPQEGRPVYCRDCYSKHKSF